MNKQEMLKEREKMERALIVAQLCRNQFTISFCNGLLSNLKGTSDWNGKLKQWVRMAEDFEDRYNADLNAHCADYGVIEDKMYDAAYEFGRYAKVKIEQYKQSVIRAVQVMKIPDANIIGPIMLAKDMAGINAMICSLEAQVGPNIYAWSSIGGGEKLRVQGQDASTPATTVARMWKLCQQVVFEMLCKRGLKDARKIVFDCDEHPEAGRILIQCSEQLLEVLNWHAFFWALAENPGITAEEAEIKAKEIDENLRKKKEKLERQQALKNAKRNGKRNPKEDRNSAKTAC